MAAVPHVKVKQMPKPIDKAPYWEHNGVRHFMAWAYEDDEDTPFCEVSEFSATLTFVGISRGRSSLRFDFIDEANSTLYSMFQSGFEEMLKAATMQNGSVTGKFHHVKWGNNYGIEMIWE